MVCFQRIKESIQSAADSIKTTVRETFQSAAITTSGVVAILHPNPIVSALSQIACAGLMTDLGLQGLVRSPYFRSGAALVTAFYAYYDIYSVATGLTLIAIGKTLHDFCVARKKKGFEPMQEDPSNPVIRAEPDSPVVSPELELASFPPDGSESPEFESAVTSYGHVSSGLSSSSMPAMTGVDSTAFSYMSVSSGAVPFELEPASTTSENLLGNGRSSLPRNEPAATFESELDEKHIDDHDHALDTTNRTEETPNTHTASSKRPNKKKFNRSSPPVTRSRMRQARQHGQ